MPTTLQSFTGLITMKMYNSTISSWPETAGLTSAQASLRGIFLIRTNFTNAVFPPGLERCDIPSSVSMFVASATNLVSLPDSLDTVWPKLMTIAIEQFSAVALSEPNMASVMDVSTPSRLVYSFRSATCMPIAQTIFPLAVEDATSHVHG